MKIQELPPRIAEYMAAYFPSLKNVRLASRYRLNDEQTDTFVLSIGKVFLKEVEPKDFPKLLTDDVKLPSGQAFLLAAETAEQHFTAFQDFLGPTNDLIERWQHWGREFGGKQPDAKADPEVEQLISKAWQVDAPSIEVRKPGEAKAVAEQIVAQRQGADVQPRSAPVQQRAPEQRAAAPARVVTSGPTRSVPPAAPASPGMSREQFLDQVRQFTIEKLRPAGQPAVQRLQQVRTSLEQVVAGTPGDQPAVADALHASPLFRLYQEMGQESLRSQKPIDHVIYERYSAQRPYLLREEFDAVAQIAAIAPTQTVRA